MSSLSVQNLNFTKRWQVLDFEDAISDETGGNKKIKKSEYQVAGKYPIFDQGQDAGTWFTDEEDFLYKGKLPVILFGDHTRSLKIVNTPFALGADGVKALKPKEGLDEHFVYELLKTIRLPEDAGYSRHFKFLKTAKIPKPKPEEQNHIAEILDRAEALKQKRQQTLKLADELLRATFLSLFGDPITNPKGWPVRELGDLIPAKGAIVDGPFGSSVNTKVDYIDEAEIPVIRTKNVSINGEFIKDDLKFMRRDKYETILRSNVKPGDIILTKVGTIGNLCIFPNDFEEAVLSTTGSCRIRVPVNVVNTTYLYHFLRRYKPKMLEIASAGVQPFLNMKHVKSFLVPLPNRDLQDKFEQIVKKVEALKAKIQTSETEIEHLAKSLSQKAFRGEL
jgi:type I restriction enzyme S subunit